MVNKRLIYGIIALSLIMIFIISIMYINIVIKEDQLPDNKYVAIEEEICDDGKIISGNNPVPPDAPLPIKFLYNRPMAQIYYNKSGNFPPDYPEINNSLNILWGIYQIENTPEHLRTSLIVHGVYDLPHNVNNGLKILNVNKSGIAKLSYNNTMISLSPGETWTSPIIQTRTVIRNGTYMDKNYSYVVEFTTTFKITNLGVFDKYMTDQ
ncbi:hypothetical protein [Methanocella arvoryzae]|uniref:Uncharacterized protein n=1 Tax=Methanocella arvoryzae (strain DSM 22066 / NBRC 105507 / MRE50) TaxID=351160 RepID=Q0W0S8_METAR|nr:hypothetical protein [Methanocella arvoryzae]CAJ38015.1 hypothetical protein RRC280 [Methanocella arvoryzae MRE50]